MIRALPAVAALVLLAACSRPEMPDKDKPVEPKSAVRHDDLRRAIDAPLQKARNADQAASIKASQDAAIDAAESGDDAGH